jgi:hypothetical protein
MNKRVLFRFLFVVLIGAVLGYYWYSFRQHLKSTSDAVAHLDARTEWVLVLQNWDNVGTWVKADSTSQLRQTVVSDIRQWQNWCTQFPEVQKLFAGHAVYLGYGASISKNVVWYWGIPDKWSSQQVEHLIQLIPNLKVWGDVLVWSMDGGCLGQLQMPEESSVAQWQTFVEELDESHAVGWVSQQNQQWLALDFDQFEWVGLMSADSNVMATPAIQWDSTMTVSNPSLRSFCVAAPEWNLDSSVRASFKVFSSDTACDCDTWEAWTQWQSSQWFFEQYPTGWVAVQHPKSNPKKWMYPLLKDTTQKIMQLRHPDQLPPLTQLPSPKGWRLASQTTQRHWVLATDSASLQSYQKDSTQFLFMSFPASERRHLYREMWQGQNFGEDFSWVKGKNWLAQSGKGELNVFASDRKDRRIVQIRIIK